MKRVIFCVVILLLFALLTSVSCNRRSSHMPKPTGYFRLDLPEKNYKEFDKDCPFKFEMPTYSFVVNDDRPEFCWFDIYFPKLKAKIYLTYKPVNNNLHSHLEDSREFVYKHTVKADAIQEIRFENDSLDVYGMLYDLKGNTASAIQFFLTDSVNHFLRGSLYFNVRPNKDSLAPAIDFIRDDIIHIIESFEWK